MKMSKAQRQYLTKLAEPKLCFPVAAANATKHSCFKHGWVERDGFEHRGPKLCPESPFPNQSTDGPRCFVITDAGRAALAQP